MPQLYKLNTCCVSELKLQKLMRLTLCVGGWPDQATKS